ncbi:MAG TPA: response regulator [Gemmataceae bacterium]|nr:response regulator [Gemmataceae bacterium]
MGFQVLVVDDYSDSADSLAMFLQMSGFDVRVAYSGEAAVAMALADRPDAVLCDINMPGLDGFGVARRLRSAIDNPPLLIAVTARREQELVGPAAAAGFDHYFLKPADPVEVGGLLADYAAGRVNRANRLDHDHAAVSQHGPTIP